MEEEEGGGKVGGVFVDGDECRREGEMGGVREGGDKPTREQARKKEGGGALRAGCNIPLRASCTIREGQDPRNSLQTCKSPPVRDLHNASEASWGRAGSDSEIEAEANGSQPSQTHVSWTGRDLLDALDDSLEHAPHHSSEHAKHHSPQRGLSLWQLNASSSQLLASLPVHPTSTSTPAVLSSAASLRTPPRTVSSGQPSTATSIHTPSVTSPIASQGSTHAHRDTALVCSTVESLTPSPWRQEIRLLPSVEEEVGGGFKLEAALAKSASVTAAAAHSASLATVEAATTLAGVCVCRGWGSASGVVSW